MKTLPHLLVSVAALLLSTAVMAQTSASNYEASEAKYKSQIKAAKEAYDKAVVDATRQMIVAVDLQLKNVMKSGDLDAANKLNVRKKELQDKLKELTTETKNSVAIVKVDARNVLKAINVKAGQSIKFTAEGAWTTQKGIKQLLFCKSIHLS